ncbi:MAG TPA: hypothetical protein GX707_01750 [Epulopiscium sp.]|nr:hypothetical protein [Candidatus Epulonipiscium sp.]
MANREGVYFIDYGEDLYKKLINQEARKISTDVYQVIELENQKLEWYMW